MWLTPTTRRRANSQGPKARALQHSAPTFRHRRGGAAVGPAGPSWPPGTKKRGRPRHNRKTAKRPTHAFAKPQLPLLVVLCCDDQMFFRSGLALLLSFPVWAQWPAYPTPGLPKLPDGSPDYAAPAPKTPDNKPDFSGVWAPSRRGVLNSLEGQGVPGRPTGPFWDLNSVVPGGLPYQPWAKQLRDKRWADFGKDNPDVGCYPLGILQDLTHQFPRRVLQSPSYVALLMERNFSFRQIFLDGRPLPEDPNPA